MHKSAMLRMKWFVENYVPKDRKIRVLDVGSYDVNGCYKPLFVGYDVEYVGLDMHAGPNVDIVPAHIYAWEELKSDTFDFVISGNTFEHIEYPWLTITEIERVLKPGGITCILVPFAHVEHRYPVDCYRYFGDGLSALAKWAGLKVIQSSVGGIPENATPEWFDPTENYDDSVLIAVKRVPSSEVNLSIYPTLASTHLTRKWTISQKIVIDKL